MAKLFFIGGYSREIVLAVLYEQVLRRIGSFPSGENPSLLALHPNLPVLYAANEIANGSVEAFSFDKWGSLSRFGSSISTGGNGPAFISVDPSGNWLLSANYNGGSYGVGKIDASNGELVAPVSFVQVPKLKTPPVNPGRQEGPHPHQIITDASGEFVFVCDLGNDEIHLKTLRENGALGERGVGSVKVIPGSGPRHMIFSQDKRFAYVINELTSTLGLYSYNSSCGELRFSGKSWSTLGETKVPGKTMTAAELVLSSDGKFLYASNRGDDEDTIAVFGVDSGSGELELLGLDKVGGSGPRHFALDPSGEMVVVGLQLSNKVSLMKRNPTTGRLSLLFVLDGVEQPTFIQFINV